MYRLISKKAAHFLSAQMALLSSFFQMFKVLGMYNFSLDQKNTHAMEQIVCGIVIKQIWFKYNCKKTTSKLHNCFVFKHIAWEVWFKDLNE